MAYLLNILIMGGLFSILSISLNVTSGYAGILSLAQAAFYGIGAYTVALLTVKGGVPFFPALFLAGMFASICGCLIGIPTLRLKGDYLLIATLGFSEIFSNMLLNLDSITEGPRGITSIPPANFFGFEFNSDLKFLILLTACFSLCAVSSYLLKKSPFGQILYAVAEDEDGVAAMGRKPSYFKITTISFSTFWAGLAGGLFAVYAGYINPSSFSLNESIMIFSMILLGGLRSICGAVIGAFVLVSLPELMRFVGFAGTTAALSRQLLYGALLILIMYFRPQGIMGTLEIR